jgi:YidC/Oxa1 family membrane protein insertase
MDKRFFLALLLTAIVVILTPLVFPSRSSQRQPGTTSPAADSAALARARGDTALRTGATAAATPTPETPPAPHAEAPPPAVIGAATTPVAAETTTVETPLATYQFSSVGAAPTRVVMKQFRALNGTGGQVQLVPPGEALLRYTLVTGGDSIPLSRTPFQVARSTSSTGADVLRYTAILPAAQVLITYSFVPDSYLVRVAGQVNGELNTPAYLVIGMPRTIQSNEADSLDDQRSLAYAYKAENDDAEGIPFGSLDPGERKLAQGPITWVAAKSKYFIVGLLTQSGDAPFVEFAATGGPRTSKTATLASGVAVEPLPDGRFAFELYTGPQEWRRLLALGREFENSNPYGGFMQAIVQPFATIVMRILLWMKETFRINYGWVLVIFGVAIRLILWPLNQKAMRTNMKMQRLQPQLAELQKRYRDEPQKLHTEMMQVYKEHGMSPFSAVSGCLPLLLPMPILFALFFVFQSTIEFRGVPFLWLADISLKDPYYILPLLMGVSMFVLSWLGMRNVPPNPQSKIMLYFFPIFMTFVLLNFASGLNLYYTVQNLAALPQQWIIANERAKSAAARPA